MTIPDLLKEIEDKMKKTVEATRHDYTQIRTGRANAAMVDHLIISYYGQDLPILQVAAITVPEPRQLLITPWDKNALSAVEKAILKSDLNITPNNDGIAVRLNIPPLTEERRKDFIKQLHKKEETGHTSIRNLRHDANNRLKVMTKAKECSEDDEKRAQEKTQKLTDLYIAEIAKATKIKEQELLEV